MASGSFQSYLENDEPLAREVVPLASFDQSLDHRYVSPYSLRADTPSIQAFLEDETPLVRSYRSPHCPSPRKSRAQKLLAKLGVDKSIDIFLAYRLEFALDIWLEIADNVANFLATKGGMGNDTKQAARRFAISNMLMALALALLLAVSAILTRLLIGPMLGIACTCLLVAAWISRENSWIPG